MLKLEATLIARTALRPRRCGWSLDHGIDFIVMDRNRAITAAPGIGLTGTVAAERACFLDADDIIPGTTVVSRYVSLAAQAAEAAACEPADVPLTRAWSSVARKLPGS
jgi:hypothetical protein